MLIEADWMDSIASFNHDNKIMIHAWFMNGKVSVMYKNHSSHAWASCIYGKIMYTS